MKIKVERSGGFTGIPFSSEIVTHKIPPSIQGTVQQLLHSNESPPAIGSKQPKGSADYLNYRITIQNGIKHRVVECSDFELDKNMRSLIRYVQKSSRKKSKSSLT